MTEETAEILRLDYSKPPPGYTVRFEDSSGANGDGRVPAASARAAAYNSSNGCVRPEA